MTLASCSKRAAAAEVEDRPEPDGRSRRVVLAAERYRAVEAQYFAGFPHTGANTGDEPVSWTSLCDKDQGGAGTDIALAISMLSRVRHVARENSGFSLPCRSCRTVCRPPCTIMS